MRRMIVGCWILTLAFIVITGFLGLGGFSFQDVYETLENEAGSLAFLLGEDPKALLNELHVMLETSGTLGFAGEEVKLHHRVGRWYMVKLLFTVRLYYFVSGYPVFLVSFVMLSFLSYAGIKSFMVNGALNLQQSKMILQSLAMICFLSLVHLLFEPAASNLVLVLFMLLLNLMTGLVHFALLGWH